MNDQIRDEDYLIGNNQMVSNDTSSFTNSINIGEPIRFIPQIVPDNFPNMVKFLSNVELHPNSVTSSNVKCVSTMCHSTEESSHVTRNKHTRVECDEGELRQRKQPKKARSSEANGSSERRRRERLREKMLALKELLPNTSSAKSDQASLLDQAIRHIKSLQSQLQVLSMGFNPCQIAPSCVESARGRLDSFTPLPHLLMERPILPPAYLNPHHLLHSNQPGIWAPSAHETLLRQPAFVDNSSATALPQTFGSGITQSVPTHTDHPVPSAPSNVQLVPTIQNQTSFLEDPFAVIQHYPPLN